MLYYNIIDINKGIDLATSNNNKKKVGFFTIGFLIIDSDFKIIYVMVVMI